MDIHVLVITHKYGSNVYTHKTYEGLKRTLYEYVKEWWQEYYEIDLMPKDRDKAIEYYFENNDREFYDTFVTTLKD